MGFEQGAYSRLVVSPESTRGSALFTSMTMAPRYAQNDNAYDHHHTHVSTDSLFKYGGSQYETGYGVPGISSWPNRHAEVPSLHRYAYS